MRFRDIATESLPADIAGPVTEAIEARWAGARIYMPTPARAKRQGAARAFAAHLHQVVRDAGGSDAQTHEILVALSGGYFWV